MLVKIEARILIFPGTDFHFPSMSVPLGTFLGSVRDLTRGQPRMHFFNHYHVLFLMNNLDSSSKSNTNSKVKVKFSHTRYRALGPELIPVYRQSARR